MYKKILNQININLFAFFISIIISIQIYLFKEIRKNDIKINKLNNCNIELVQKYKNIKEKIQKLDIIQRDMQKINIHLAQILQTDKYLVDKVRYLSEILYKRRDCHNGST